MPEDCVPLSLSQRRFWILDQLHPGIAAYHIPVCLRLTGPLAFDALERSLGGIVARHGSLRTTFGVRDGAPVQVVKPFCPIPLRLRDISAHPGADLEAQAYSFVHAEILKPFDLKNGPLIRAALLRLGPQHHILISTMHHIVSDGWSAELFVQELAEHYGAFSADRELSLNPLPMQYFDFTILQQRMIPGDRIQEQLSFWQRTLAGAPALHDFPCDRARPEEPTYAGASRTLKLDQELVADLQQFARRQRATFFMLLAATFQVLLSKYGKQKDILIGIPVSGRNIVETESLIGLFVNTIVLRTSFSENPSFIEVLTQVRKNLLDAMSHQDAPFDLIVDTVRPARSLSYSPLFQIMFSTFRAAVQSRLFGQLTATPYVVETNTSRFDLSVNVIEGVDRTWWVQAEYSTELFDDTRIARMLETYRALLQSVLVHSQQRLSDLRPSHDAGEVLANTLQPLTSAAASGSIANSSTKTNAVRGRDRAGEDIASANEGRAAISFEHVEPKLIEIWQKAFRVSPIAVDADFFELGGNSLLAVAMIADLNRTFGKKIPVTTVFRNPTIRQLAERLREQSIFKSSFVPLVESGAKPPLFAASSNYRFRDLSRALGSDQPLFQMDIFALQEERLIAEEPLLTTIEDIAAHFTREISAVQPSGPYFLAGACEGGIVALEIARQLQRQGQCIEALMQFDTPPTGYFRFPAWHRRVLEAFRRGEAPERIIRSISQRIRDVFTRRSATQDYIWNVIWDAVIAHGNDKTFDGEILLFRAIRANGFVDVATGWDRIGALRIFDVPGYHESLFSNQVAQAIIRGVLEDAQRRIPASRLESESNAQLRTDRR
jgi:thioesterase domain-containing protein/acyl carrier protein